MDPKYLPHSTVYTFIKDSTPVKGKQVKSSWMIFEQFHFNLFFLVFEHSGRKEEVIQVGLSAGLIINVSFRQMSERVYERRDPAPQFVQSEHDGDRGEADSSEVLQVTASLHPSLRPPPPLQGTPAGLTPLP